MRNCGVDLVFGLSVQGPTRGPEIQGAIPTMDAGQARKLSNIGGGENKTSHVWFVCRVGI